MKYERVTVINGQVLGWYRIADHLGDVSWDFKELDEENIEDLEDSVIAKAEIESRNGVTIVGGTSDTIKFALNKQGYNFKN